MNKTYYQCARRLWLSHGIAPLKASDIALYFLLLHEAHRNGWRMPVHVANGMIVPMLFEKGTLEQSRKRLVEHGLIEYTKPKGNSSVPSYKIVGIEDCTDTTDEPNDELFIKAVNRVWTAFDDMALNASEIALYFYVINAAEQASWQMPVRFRDAAVAPLMMHLSALRKAREELARRRLITFDLGDPKRTVPKYTIVTDGKLASAACARLTAKPSERKSQKPSSEQSEKQKPEQPEKPSLQQQAEQPSERPTAQPEKPQPKQLAPTADKHDESLLHGQFGEANKPEDYGGSFV